MPRTPRIQLTDRFVKRRHLQPGDYMDSDVPRFGLRVSENGIRSYIMRGRFPLNPNQPTRRTIAQVGEITLVDARKKAQAWNSLILDNIDPKTQAANQLAAEQQKQALIKNSFKYVAGEFLHRHCEKLSHYEVSERIVNNLIKAWGDKPITSITPAQCAEMIRGIAKKTPGMAYNVASMMRRLFSWSLAQMEFGLERSPCEALRPADLIGARKPRERILDEQEIPLVWQACEKEGYPFGRLLQALLLTGARLREISDLKWSEVDLDRKLITIPSTRTKAKREHIIPICPMLLALLESLPRFSRGPGYVFTMTGTKAITGFNKPKHRIDAASGVGLTDEDAWVAHDLRRTMRSNLSALPIEDRVREQMIGHAQPGLHAVYDRHAYSDEKVRGFQLWEARLAGILNPATVTDIGSARKRRAA